MYVIRRGDGPLSYHVIVARIKNYLPTITRLPFTLFVEKKAGHRVDISDDPRAVWLGDLLARVPQKPRPVDVGWNATAVLMYTGGATGVSKGAQLTQEYTI